MLQKLETDRFPCGEKVRTHVNKKREGTTESNSLTIIDRNTQGRVLKEQKLQTVRQLQSEVPAKTFALELEVSNSKLITRFVSCVLDADVICHCFLLCLYSFMVCFVFIENDEMADRRKMVIMIKKEKYRTVHQLHSPQLGQKLWLRSYELVKYSGCLEEKSSRN